MGKSRKSEVWNHFSPVNVQEACCRYCNLFTRHNKNTTNLWSHLKSKHSDVYDAVVDRKGASDVIGPSASSSTENFYNHNENLIKNELYDRDNNYGDDSMAPPSSKYVPRARKSIVWQHFISSDSNDMSMICNHCGIEVKNNKNTTNLWSHLKFKHPEILENNGSSIDDDYQLQDENMLEVNLICHDDDDDNNDDNDDSQRQFKRENDYYDDNYYSSSSKPIQTRIKKSLVWSHFVPVAPMEARCIHCNLELRHHKNTTNLWAHLKSKHRENYKILLEEKNMNKSFDSNHQWEVNDDDFNDYDEDIDEEDYDEAYEQYSKFNKSKKSLVWKHFQPVDSIMANCFHCFDDVRHNGNTTNLWNHLKSRHEPIYQESFDLKQSSSTSSISSLVIPHPQSVPSRSKYKKKSLVWDQFDPLDKSTAICFHCGNKVAHHGNTTNMWKHLQLNHPQIYSNSIEEKKNSSITSTSQSSSSSNSTNLISQPSHDFKRPKKSLVWCHFKALSFTMATCDHCYSSVSHNGTTNLWIHLKIKHPEIYDILEKDKSFLEIQANASNTRKRSHSKIEQSGESSITKDDASSSKVIINHEEVSINKVNREQEVQTDSIEDNQDDNSKLYEASHPKQIKFNQAFEDFIQTTKIPIDVLRTEEFKKLINVVDPKLSINPNLMYNNSQSQNLNNIVSHNQISPSPTMHQPENLMTHHQHPSPMTHHHDLNLNSQPQNLTHAVAQPQPHNPHDLNSRPQNLINHPQNLNPQPQNLINNVIQNQHKHE